MAQPYRVLPGARPLKKQARTARRGPRLVVERKETAASVQSASSSEDYAATAHPGSAKPVHCTCWWRAQPHFPRQRRVLSPGTRMRPTAPQHHLARPRAWGFGSIRSPVTACRRHVAPLMLQFPPTFHIRAAETSCNTQPGPRLVTPHKKARPIPAPHRTARGRLSNQTQSEDSNCNELIGISTRISS